MNLTAVGRSLLSDASGFFNPKENIDVSSWMEREIHLPPKVAQTAGPFTSKNCTYVRECAEDFRDPEVTDSTLCFGGQVFKTTTMMGGLCYTIDQRPVSALWIMPNERLAQTFSELKFQPLVDESPAVVRHKPRNADKYKKLEMQFDSADVTFIGAGSKKNLKGRSVGLSIIDEADDVEEAWALRGESAIAMAQTRTKSYAGSKRFLTGTPTTVQAPVWRTFMEGDQRLRFVECPLCHGKPFVLEFDPDYVREWFPKVNSAKVVWDKEAKNEDGTWNHDAVEKSARFQCPNCKAHIAQHQMQLMLRAAKWIAQNANAARGKVSRRLPSWYSPHESCTIGKIAVKFLASLSTAGGLRNFLNEDAALPWQPKGTTVTKSDIRNVARHSPCYLLGQIPDIAPLACLIMTVDVQHDCFWWVIRAHYANFTSALVHYEQALSWQTLIDYHQQAWPIMKTDKTASCLFGLIDSGDRAKREGGVYEFTQGLGAGRFIPTKGASTTQGLKKDVEESDVEYKGMSVKLTRYNDAVFKYLLYLTTIKERVNNNWFIPQNFGNDYERGLSDEYLEVKQDPKGYSVSEWKTRDDFNHLGDCEKKQFIIPSMLGREGIAALAKRVEETAKVKT